MNQVRQMTKRVVLQARGLPRAFLYGAFCKLGSSAVTLILIWWQARH